MPQPSSAGSCGRYVAGLLGRAGELYHAARDADMAGNWRSELLRGRKGGVEGAGAGTGAKLATACSLATCGTLASVVRFPITGRSGDDCGSGRFATTHAAYACVTSYTSVFKGAVSDVLDVGASASVSLFVPIAWEMRS